MRERVKEKLKENLKNKMVSLNIDEPTNNNNDKMLNVIAQHYNTCHGQFVIEHLGSRVQNVATAAKNS